jgi:copper type II ascorbate-dependent monooxygenase-like protein
MTRVRLACVSPVLLALLTCGCNSDGDDDPAAPDATAAGGWEPLLTGDWSIAAGTENWYCMSRTLDRDLFIGGFRPIDPLGTHHTILSFGPPVQPDHGATTCAPENTNPYWVYASGVNINDLSMPPGVGVVIEAGQQIHVNLHVFNTGTSTLSGTSGVEILPLDRSAVEHEAEVFPPGPYGFQIPPNQEYSFSSTCPIREEQHIFAIFPHMHQRGRHLKSELTIGGQRQVLWDDDFQFDAQQYARFDPIQLSAGDTVTTTCTWFYEQEPGGRPMITWGQSSEDEMCFGILMRYPRVSRPEDLGRCTDEDLGP